MDRAVGGRRWDRFRRQIIRPSLENPLWLKWQLDRLDFGRSIGTGLAADLRLDGWNPEAHYQASNQDFPAARILTDRQLRMAGSRRVERATQRVGVSAAGSHGKARSSARSNTSTQSCGEGTSCLKSTGFAGWSPPSPGSGGCRDRICDRSRGKVVSGPINVRLQIPHVGPFQL